ncbi:hypothetical protein [Amycolatopsis sp. NPDC021455]|uniref:hypothetical protein n=1 Tax=Amycolatopsis sp. NPDC021455 TaxID=3154901 RepID=UPI0033C641C8
MGAPTGGKSTPRPKRKTKRAEAIAAGLDAAVARHVACYGTARRRKADVPPEARRRERELEACLRAVLRSFENRPAHSGRQNAARERAWKALHHLRGTKPKPFTPDGGKSRNRVAGPLYPVHGGHAVSGGLPGSGKRA